MNSWWQGEELIYGLQDCGASLVILDGTRLTRMGGWLQGSGLLVIAVDTGGAPLPDDIDRLEPLLANTTPCSFPEIDIDKINKIMGLEITFVTSGGTDEEGTALLKAFGMPFKHDKN